MSASVKWTGLRELAAQLAAQPLEVRQRGMDIVRDETEQAARDIVALLPRKTGTLASRVKTEYPSSTRLIGVVRSRAPHSHIYEFGTRRRQTSGGANRGVMPAHPVTPRIAVSRRARMVRRLVDLLRTLGFQVKTT